MNERDIVIEMCKAYNSVLLNQPQNERNQFLAMLAALAYARTVMGKSGDSDDGHKVQFESALPANLMEATGLTATSGKTEGFATREDAKPVASASDAKIISQAHRETHWRERHNTEDLQEFATNIIEHKEAQHKQKVRELAADIQKETNETGYTYNAAIELINKHFGE